MHRKNTRRGFTLIELLVVIAIIGVLSSIVMAALSQGRKSSRDAARVESLRQVKVALELYYDTNRIFPGTSNTWYDMSCDGILNPDDGAAYTDFSTLSGLVGTFIQDTPTPISGVCMWYQPRNSGQGYRLTYIPELAKTLNIDMNCYNSTSWYCTGVNW